MKKIKILFVLPKAQQGGAERQLLYLIKGMNVNKFEIYLGFLYDCQEMKKEFEKIPGLHIIYFNKKKSYDLSIYFKIAKFAKTNDINIIHTFLGNHHAYLPSIINKKIIPIGGIMGSQDKTLSLNDKITEFHLGRLISKLRKYYLISCSYAGRDVYLRRGFKENTVFAIPNGIDYDYFSKGNSSKIKKEFNLDNKIVLGMVGRLIDTKNHKELILIFKELQKKHANLILLIVGDGPLKSDLQKLTEELKLSDKIIFTGNRKDIPDLLAAMNIFTFTSLTEGWPNAIGEAMSARLPVVTYNAGDVSKIIKQGVNGYIAKNQSEFIQITEKLISNKTLIKKIGQTAKKTIENNYTINKMITDYENFYIILNKKSREK